MVMTTCSAKPPDSDDASEKLVSSPLTGETNVDPVPEKLAQSELEVYKVYKCYIDQKVATKVTVASFRQMLNDLVANGQLGMLVG